MCSYTGVVLALGATDMLATVASQSLPSAEITNAQLMAAAAAASQSLPSEEITNAQLMAAAAAYAVNEQQAKKKADAKAAEDKKKADEDLAAEKRARKAALARKRRKAVKALQEAEKMPKSTAFMMVNRDWIEPHRPGVTAMHKLLDDKFAAGEMTMSGVFVNVAPT